MGKSARVSGEGKGMKSKRQQQILELITASEIETQEELAEALGNRGYKTTQATISRDIRELQLIKVASSSGRYKYACPQKRENAVSERLIRILSDSLVSIDYAGHTIVVKTISGSANVAAEAIDTLQWPEVLGTIAGDNTIFIVVKNESLSAEITERIRRIAAE